MKIFWVSNIPEKICNKLLQLESLGIFSLGFFRYMEEMEGFR